MASFVEIKVAKTGKGGKRKKIYIVMMGRNKTTFSYDLEKFLGLLNNKMIKQEHFQAAICALKRATNTLRRYFLNSERKRINQKYQMVYALQREAQLLVLARSKRA